MSLRDDVKKSVHGGIRFAIVVTALAALRCAYDVLSPSSHPISPLMIPMVFAASFILYGLAGAGIPLLNWLADQGFVGCVLTGMAIGGVFSGGFMMLEHFSEGVWTAVEFRVVALGPLALGLVGGIGLGAYRWWRNSFRDESPS